MIVCLRLTRKEHKGILFLDDRSVLYLYHDGGYHAVKFVRTHEVMLKMSAHYM